MKNQKLSQITRIYLKICKKSNKSWSKIKNFKNIYDFVFAKSSEKYFFIDLKHINDSEFKQDLWNFSNSYRVYACYQIYEEIKNNRRSLEQV
ncbi:hypothetical protein [Mycoplasmopsis fermentans]|uniref:hypothetical protein n=1 Tax=Mycoplasmopsis fermentans TaxID=2115 RepID=UPI0009D65647|nr:hypothetical protein [Mycoplasmopsis fermentans]